jgi:hypothetical protein
VTETVNYYENLKNRPKKPKTQKQAIKYSMSDFTAMLKEILSFTLDEKTDYLELVAFSGFDPLDVFKKIAPKLTDSKAKKLLQYAITFALTRGFGGNKNFAILEDRTKTPAGKSQLREARSLFNIVITTAKTKDDVTFDRLMAAFPSVTHKIWVHICQKENCPEKFAEYDGELPDELRYPGSPAAMNEATYKKYFAEYCNWMQGLQEIWGRNGNNRGGKQTRETVEKFANLQYNTNLFPMKNRPDHSND